MKTKFNAVLHLKSRDFAKVANLATRVIAGLTANSSDYPAPDPALSELSTENKKLIKLNAEAKGNTLKKDERDQQTLVVFNLLSKELKYVNSIAKGNKVLVDKSGFDAEKEPEPHDIPPTPVIKKAKDGKLAHSAKLFLAGPLIRDGLYTVQVVYFDVDGVAPPAAATPGSDAFDPDSLPWKNALETVSSKELLVLNLKRGKEMAFRVRAHDGSKKSRWSEPHFFMAR